MRSQTESSGCASLQLEKPTGAAETPAYDPVPSRRVTALKDRLRTFDRSSVLLLELTQPLHLRRHQARVALAPVVECRFRVPAFRQTSPIAAPSSACFNTNAICASETSMPSLELSFSHRRIIGENSSQKRSDSASTSLPYATSSGRASMTQLLMRLRVSCWIVLFIGRSTLCPVSETDTTSVRNSCYIIDLGSGPLRSRPVVATEAHVAQGHGHR